MARKPAQDTNPSRKVSSAPADRAEASDAPAQRRKGKRIVLFSDGTGNSSAKLFKTNVWRLYDALDVDPIPDAEGAGPATGRRPGPGDPVRQIAFYDDGVGTSSFKPMAILGGVLGVGLARNVRDIYAFLCRHYEGETAEKEADEIYGFGFSRGAFTMRVVSGLICNQGVIRHFEDEADLQRKVAAAYRAYRGEKYDLNSFAAPMVAGCRWLRDRVLALRDRMFGYQPYKAHEADPGIEFLGLWDTVDAYGLPIEEMTAAWDQYIWPLTMRDYVLNPKIKRARQVLALDDERQTFHPRLWQDDPRDADVAGVDGRRIAQVWFAGVHSNVGGGYPNDSLSFVSLNWMIERVNRDKRGTFGLRWRPDRLATIAASADPLGPIYDSRKGMAGYYRYQPRRQDLVHRDEDKSLVKRLVGKIAPPLASNGNGAGLLELSRSVKTGYQLVHHSVFDRMQAGGAAAYAPLTVEVDCRVVGPDAAGALVAPAGAAGGPISAGQAKAWNEGIATIDDLVWLRRVVYFLTLFATLWLAAFPLLYSIEKTGGDDPTLETVVSVAPQIIAAFLPGFLKPWIDAFAANARQFLALALCVGGLLALGVYLAGTIQSQLQRLWRAAPMRLWFWWPPVGATIRALRTADGYQWLHGKVKTWVMPLVFACAFYVLGLALIGRVIFSLSTEPDVCGAAIAKAPDWRALEQGEEIKIARTYAVADPCWASGVKVVGGARYEIRLTAQPLAAPLPADARVLAGRAVLLDASIRADAFGLSDDQSHRTIGSRLASAVAMFIAVPLRRDVFAPWFTQFIRIGAQGRDVQALSPKVPPAPGVDARGDITAQFTARRNGELMLYTNDAMGLLGGAGFYANNSGAFAVTVRRLDWDANYSRH